MNEPRVIRPSSLTTAGDCLRRWAARHLTSTILDSGYTLGTARPLHIGAAVGSGVHAAFGYTLLAKLGDAGDLGSETEAVDRAEAEFNARAEYGLTWDATTNDLSTAKRQMQRMTRTFRRHLAPKLDPLVVEKRLEADIGDGWVLSGQGDTLAGNPDADVHDLKTGTTQRANGVQYAAYHDLFTAHGYRPHRMFEDFVARTRMSNEQPEPTSTAIDVPTAKADAWELIGDIKRSTAEFERRLQVGDKPPLAAFRANPASPLCGAKWCTAFGTDFCRAHKGAV